MPGKKLTHCPETGRDLEGVDIRAHIQNLWPALDEKDKRFEQARERRRQLLEEAERREAHAPKPDSE
jgi:hypothetical protein